MTYKVYLEKRALKEIESGLEYYSTVNRKVLKNFSNEIKNAFKIISKSPFFQKRYKDFRVYPLKKYPYLIVYTINENSNIITVFAVFNSNQNPTKLP